MPRFFASWQIASRTTPTAWVLVMQIGEVSRPCSASQIVPVISPLPLKLW